MTPMGKAWMRQMKVVPGSKPTAQQMASGLVIAIVGAFLLYFVFQHSFVAYRDAYRLDGARTDKAGLTMMDGLQGAFFTWLGFFVPLLASRVAWERQSWALFFNNAAYYLVTLL